MVNEGLFVSSGVNTSSNLSWHFYLFATWHISTLAKNGHKGAREVVEDAQGEEESCKENYSDGELYRDNVTYR
jgi:hypothetical protein